jgi:hypothetical protein
VGRVGRPGRMDRSIKKISGACIGAAERKLTPNPVSWINKIRKTIFLHFYTNRMMLNIYFETAYPAYPAGNLEKYRWAEKRQ